jgi:ubiquinone/menaquinone biosynthesis C-methylase UbiE/uncharacterized protein YbaR (Trm112 family)
MHTKFTDTLRCPIAKSRLRLASGEHDPRGIVHDGILESAEGRRYPIIRGIPRFVSTEHYSHSFGVEWNRWPRLQFDDQNIGRPMAGHTTRMWETITGACDGDVRGKTIVEFGCGPGRFLDVVRRKGGKAVGIDLSLAVEAARQNFKDDPDVLIVQGDISNPPLADQSFDGGYTIGVLHHTPKPEDGLRALARMLKPGAWAACCVYPKGEFYDYPSVRRWRKITRSLRPSLGYGPPLIYSRIAAYALTEPLLAVRKICRPLGEWLMQQWLPILPIPDRRWRVLDLFDAITPEHASTHMADEVAQWMRTAGLADVTQTPWCASSWKGVVLDQPRATGAP